MGLKSILVTLVFTWVMLLVLAGAESHGWTKYIVPRPEATAEKVVNLLGSHHYGGAMQQLSEDLQQEIKEEDLMQMVKGWEESPLQGIQDAKGQKAQEQGEQATADVQVKFGNNEELVIQLPLKKEKGEWKVTSLDALKSLE
jgi:hypothetical protein